MIRVLLADDHTVLRESLALVLRGSGDCMVVGEAADGIAAIEQALALRPDVAVVDISMPRLSGIEVVRRISTELPRTHALVLTMHEEEEYVLQMIRAGAAGYLLKDAANGLVRVVGTGQNHWACIYDRDLADLYVRVSTMNDAAGIFHANDEADESVDDIVAAISQHAKMPPDVRHMPIEEARKKMGPYADALALDQIVRSPRARALGWAPTLRSVAGSVARLLEEFRTARAAA